MAPNPNVDFVYMYFHYDPSKKTKDLEVKFKHSNAKIGEFLETQKDWALQILSTEVTKLAAGTNVRFTQWCFESSNLELFTLKNFNYEKILIILGQDTVYWSFYMNSPYGRCVRGKAVINFTFCPCCINIQYERILNHIKGT